MAQIVSAIGCAHTPQLHTKAEDWDIRAARDRKDGLPLWFRGERVLYAELEELRRSEGIADMLDMDTRRRALEASFSAIDRLHKTLVAAAPDVIVIVGNDQKEIFSDIVPAFAVIATDEIANVPRTEEQIGRLPVGIEIADHGHLPKARKIFPGHREFGKHLAGHLVREAEFDVTLCHEKPTVKNDTSLLYGMPHAYGFLYNNIMRDFIKPQVPVDVNCWYGDNTPSAARCYDFGRALAKAIAAWDSPERVAVLTTGGLTHFVVDEEWDRRFLKALAEDDADWLRAIPEEELKTGTSECKSWITTGATAAEAGLKMDLVGYEKLYRTEGGTGSSCAFVSWEAT